MIIFTDGLQLENKTLEEKYRNKQGFKFAYKGKDYSHKDVFSIEKEDTVPATLETIKQQLRMKGII